MYSLLKTSAKVLLVFLSLTSEIIYAQNYKAVKTDASYYFYDSTFNDIIAIRIDSTLTNSTNTLYFNFGQIRYTGNGCFTPYGASWLGDPVIETQDGTFLFKSIDNQSGEINDTLSIKTKASLNEQWRFSGFPYSSDYIEAKLTSIQFMTFIGLTDSVKIITLTRKDASGNIIVDDINGEQIQLSKNYGLIRMPKFDTFYEFIQFYSIAGKTNPDIGFLNPNLQSVFNYEIGDAIHTKDYLANWSEKKSTTKMMIRKITGKTISPLYDWILYNYDICWQKTIVTFPDFDTTYALGQYTYNDTMYFNSSLAVQLNPEPGESCGNSNGFVISSSAYEKFGRTAKYLDWSNPIFNSYPETGCWSQVYVDAVCSPYYIAGLGGPYYDCPSYLYWNAEVVEIVYYKKGSETWGTPLNCDSLLQVGLPEYTKQQNANIYPNPTTGSIMLSIPANMQTPCKMVIFDLSGRKAGEYMVNYQEQTFDLSGFPTGLYTYKLTSANSNVIHGKFIRQ